MKSYLIAALAVVLTLGTTACQPPNEQIEKLAEQQNEILAKLKTIEANQKKILAARPAAARPQRPAEDYDKVHKIEVGDSPILGNPEAPVTIVEYSDFQCPYCARATPPLKEVQEKFGDKVRIVFKHFPLSFHKGAKPAAIASMAAQEQGKFWEMHDVLFKNQKALTDPEKMVEYAEEAGCDVEQFKKDMEANKEAYEKRVDAEFKHGQTVAVRGTPTLYINGKKVQDRSVPGMTAMVEAALKGE
jgi:protein-disulfide isomerase